MRLGGSIIRVFYNLVVDFILFQKRRNELILVHIYVKVLEIPKSYLLKKIIMYLLNIKVIVCLKQLMP
jgi:hypothetical protein